MMFYFYLVALVSAVPVIVSCDSVSGPEPAPILGACDLEPNYISQVRLNRWRDFPLRYSISESTFPSESRELIFERIEEGIQQWSVSTSGRIGSLVPAVAADEADLLIVGEDLGPVAIARTTHTTGTPFLDGGRIAFDRDAILELSRLEEGRFIEALAAHEMGHLLGIIGHPDVDGILMSAPLQARQPTTIDVNTLMHAYCRP